MIWIVWFAHVVVCFFIIVVVLLQSGNAGDISAAFGGMGSQTAFGPRGAASALSKATTWSAVIFMLTSITLSIIVQSRPTSRSVLSNVGKQKTSAPAPAKNPVTPPAPAKK